MPVELIRTGRAAAAAIKDVAKPAASEGPGATSKFAEALGELVGSVDKSAADANTAVSNMIDKTGDVHDAMIALQRAEMNLQLTVQIRNKLVQAYNDIMRMPM